MKKVALQYTPLALEDLLGIQNYIAVNLASPQAAQNTVSAITARIRNLEINPEIGTPLNARCTIASDYRFLVCGNHLVFYRFEAGVVSVIRILHSRRDFLALLFGDDLEGSSIDYYG